MLALCSFLLAFSLPAVVSPVTVNADSASEDTADEMVVENIIEEACEEYDLEEDECTSEVVAEYISDNTEVLAEVFEEVYPEEDEEFDATSIEFQIPVYVITLEEEGVYLDFNGNNGYMIIVNGDEVIAWEESGDLDYLKDLEETYYSIYDGFGYYEGEQFVAYETEYLETEDLSEIELSKQYDGQGSSGNGDIVSPSKYVKARYGSGY